MKHPWKFFERASYLTAVVLLIAVTGCSSGSPDEKVEINDQSAPESSSGRSAKEAEVDKQQIFTLSSESYADGAVMNAKHATTRVAGGENLSPQVSWSGSPEGTKAFALIMVDEYPAAGNWVHWLVVNIPASATSLKEDASMNGMPAGSVELMNTFGSQGYGGPQPPAGTGGHPYVFYLYAVSTDTLADPSSIRTKADLERALSGKVLAAAKYTGVFGR